MNLHELMWFSTAPINSHRRALEEYLYRRHVELSPYALQAMPDS